MTDAQYRRTRYKVWSDLLVVFGGAPGRNDTIHTLIRKLAIAGGVSPCCRNLPTLRLLKLLLTQLGGTSRTSDTLYQTERKLAVALGATIPCCRLPSLQALFGADSAPPAAGWSFGDPDANWSFGDPDSGYVFGEPST